MADVLKEWNCTVKEGRLSPMSCSLLNPVSKHVENLFQLKGQLFASVFERVESSRIKHCKVMRPLLLMKSVFTVELKFGSELKEGSMPLA